MMHVERGRLRLVTEATLSFLELEAELMSSVMRRIRRAARNATRETSSVNSPKRQTGGCPP